MTLYYAANVAAGVLDGTQPPRLAPASQNAGRVHSHLVVIDLATIKSSALGTSDAVHLGRLPKGGRFLYGISAATATLGASAQIAIGTSATQPTRRGPRPCSYRLQSPKKGSSETYTS